MNTAIRKPDMRPEKTTMPVQEPSERIHNFREVALGYTEEMAKAEAERCMNCPGRYCAESCPIHNPIPEFNANIREGDIEGAWKLVSENSPMPEACSRVCAQEKLCESNCTRGIKHEPVSVGALERFITDWHRKQGKDKAKKAKSNGEKVAIIGSGPSGLAGAWDLVQKGYDVTVYERQEEPGGLLMYGIPGMKIDKDVIRERVALLEKAGIRFKCNTEVGKDISSKELLKKYDAVLLAIGSTEERELQVPGSDARGIVMAVDYLKAGTRIASEKGYKMDPYMNAKGKNVIVIGAGDTGTDCVGMAVRQGARSVQQFEILSKPQEKGKEEKKPWTDWPRVLKTEYGQEEAISIFGKDPRIFDISTTDIVKKENGDVKGLNTVKVEWKQENRTSIPVPVEGSKTYWDADLVIIAMGFSGPEKTIINELGLSFDKKGNILASEDDYMTSVDKVFVCGDARRGQSMVIWGIAEGKQAAESIDRYMLEK